MFNAKEHLLNQIDGLIKEGEFLKSTKWQPNGNWVTGPPTFVDIELYKKWQSKCRSLVIILAPSAKAWNEVFLNNKDIGYGEYLSQLGQLKGLRDFINDGMLATLSNFVEAETFSNLIEQAKYLLKNGFYIAAGAVGRVVLEERIRSLYKMHELDKLQGPENCLSNLNQACYKNNIYDKLTWKYIEAMTEIGNEACHNAANLTFEKVKKLIDDLEDFLAKCPK